MIQSLYTAGAAMNATQKKIDNIANNLSNLNTIGYKESNVSFKDAMYQTMINPTGETNGSLQLGHGVILSGIVKDFSEAESFDTKSNLDFAINGDGFFAVSSGNDISYTRNGNFSLSVEATGTYLVNENGEYVLDSNLNKINLNGVEDNLSVASNGEFSTKDGIIQIGIFDFDNAEGLYSSGNNRYAVSEASGNAKLVENPKVKQYSLESSSVDITDQMTEMITAQRAYQAAAKAISTADEMEGMANKIGNR